MIEPVGSKSYVWGDNRRLVPLNKVDNKASAVSFARTCLEYAVDPVSFSE